MRTTLHAAALSIVAFALLACGGGDDIQGSGGKATTTSSGSAGSGGASPFEHPWLAEVKTLVSGEGSNEQDCRVGICRHNENTDLIAFQGAIFLVHRTAQSQVLGPNSSLVVYRSTDGGQVFTKVATLPAPVDRDIRDPHFFIVGNQLFMKALARLPVLSKRDADVDTLSLLTTSTDGVTWTDMTPIAPSTWSFWRIKEQGGTFYSAAYEDGDKFVSLYASTDGKTWQKGAAVYAIAEDTPLETELTFMPSGKLLALVRVDGTDEELLGDMGRLRTKICWSDPPYATFDCQRTFDGQRLDGPLTFFHGGRLFVVARKHLGADQRKRTALFEITGALDTGGALGIHELGELPSAGDTAYAGAAKIDDTKVLLSWYSGNLEKDAPWLFGMLDVTNIWQATLDVSKIP